MAVCRVTDKARGALLEVLTLTRAAALTSLVGPSAPDLRAGGDALSDTLATDLRDLASICKRRRVASLLARSGLRRCSPGSFSPPPSRVPGSDWSS